MAVRLHKVRVSPKEAKGLKLNYDGEDPAVVFRLGDDIQTTQPATSKLTPTWSESLIFTASHDTALKMAVFDKDRMAFDPIGTAAIGLTDLLSPSTTSVIDQWFTLQSLIDGSSAGSLRLVIEATFDKGASFPTTVPTTTPTTPAAPAPAATAPPPTKPVSAAVAEPNRAAAAPATASQAATVTAASAAPRQPQPLPQQQKTVPDVRIASPQLVTQRAAAPVASPAPVSSPAAATSGALATTSSSGLFMTLIEAIDVNTKYRPFVRLHLGDRHFSSLAAASSPSAPIFGDVFSLEIKQDPLLKFELCDPECVGSTILDLSTLPLPLEKGGKIDRWIPITLADGAVGRLHVLFTPTFPELLPKRPDFFAPMSMGSPMSPRAEDVLRNLRSVNITVVQIEGLKGSSTGETVVVVAVRGAKSQTTGKPFASNLTFNEGFDFKFQEDQKPPLRVEIAVQDGNGRGLGSAQADLGKMPLLGGIVEQWLPLVLDNGDHVGDLMIRVRPQYTVPTIGGAFLPSAATSFGLLPPATVSTIVHPPTAVGGPASSMALALAPQPPLLEYAAAGGWAAPMAPIGLPPAPPIVAREVYTLGPRGEFIPSSSSSSSFAPPLPPPLPSTPQRQRRVSLSMSPSFSRASTAAAVVPPVNGFYGGFPSSGLGLGGGTFVASSYPFSSIPAAPAYTPSSYYGAGAFPAPAVAGAFPYYPAF